MCIGEDSIGESMIAAQSAPTTPIKGPPPKRTAVAASDTVAQPEPR